MRIGPYELSSPWILAPMAAVSQKPFRVIVRELGASLAPTELVSAEGLMRLSARTMTYLRHDPQREWPYCLQLFGGDPGRMAQAARVAKEHGAKILDINMGCPVPKVTRNGAGSALMCDGTRAAQVVAAVAEATGLPVTVKIRSGWDSTSINAPELARELAAAGACAIAVHPRTRAQAYSGRADWSVIARVKQAVTVPVIGNGDVASKADAERMMRETGCDAVMVGRAALGNPWIFRELGGGPASTCEERAAMVKRHLTEHLELFGGPESGVRSFRRMLLWYARGLRGAAHFRVQATTLNGAAEVFSAVEEFFSRAEPDGRESGEAEFDPATAYG